MTVEHAPITPGNSASVIKRRFPAMGTEINVTVAICSDDQRSAAESAISEIRRSIWNFGRDWWAWGDGALSQLNQTLATGAKVKIPGAMKPLLKRAWDIHEYTDGLFDPRIGALVRLWGFDDIARLRRSPPAQADIEAILEGLHAAPDYRDGSEYGPASGVVWDVGGIGKGYIVDLSLEHLKARGFTDAIVDAGGNVATRGRCGDRSWNIGIRDPCSTTYAPVLLALLPTSDEAVITHGDDQRYFDYDGRRYSHILDPRTGTPVWGLRSLTVVHSDATLADAGGAALYVAGKDGWRSLAQRLGIRQVLAVTNDHQIHITEALASRIASRTPLKMETFA